jgi:hypothetical protein
MAEMESQMKLFEEGGLYQEGGTTDPVSGNEVPRGSLQEEVRDDIPAQLSEGEFVFPADVVRFIGLGNLMELRQKAKKGLQTMDDMGQMGNSEEAVMSDEGSYDDEIDRMIDEMDMEGNPQEFQVGGLVGYPQGAPAGGGFLPTGVAPPSQMQGVMAPQLGPQTSAMPSYETKAFIGPDGDIRYITFLNGQPLIPVPEGYTPYTPATTPVTEVATQQEIKTREDSGGDDSPQSEPVRRTVGNQFGFSDQEIPRALSFIPGVGPLVAIARGAQNINNAAAVDSARKALGMSELEFEDYVKAAFTGKYDTGVVGQLPIGGQDYTVGFGGRVTEPTEEGQKAITTLSVPEAQRRTQLAAQQAGRPMEDIMSMTRPTTAAGTTASPTVAGVASQLGQQLQEGVEMKESREIQKTLEEQQQAAEQARATAEDLKSQYDTLQSDSTRQAAQFAEQFASQQEALAQSLQKAQESQLAAEQARQSADELREQYNLFRTDTLAEQAQYAESLAETRARIAEYDKQMANLVTGEQLDARIREIPIVAPVSPVEVAQAYPERDIADAAEDAEAGRVMREAEAEAEASRRIDPTTPSRPVDPGESVTYTDKSGNEQTVTGKSYTDASGRERAGSFVDNNNDGEQQSNERSTVTSSDGSAVRSGSGSVVTSRSQDEIDRDSGGGGGGGGGGCVIATHGIQTGAFTLREKATAELYCMKNFHGTWWGEAFRRGYRYVGMQHIKNGTAESVYQEFKDFVKTGRGLKKDIVSKMKWLSRVVQFIIAGLTIARK